MNTPSNSTPPALWFRAKTYGYGWTPSTWQGWACIAAWAAVNVAVFLTLRYAIHIVAELPLYMTPCYLLTTLALIGIAYAKGEPASWRWGKK